MGQLHKENCWVWLYCEHRLPPDHQPCGHSAPMAIAPLVIRWGPNASTDKLRRCAKCKKCGGQGASIKAPSWVNSLTGFQPFPVERMNGC